MNRKRKSNIIKLEIYLKKLEKLKKKSKKENNTIDENQNGIILTKNN